MVASPAFTYPSVVERRHPGPDRHRRRRDRRTAASATPSSTSSSARRRRGRATTRRSSDGLDQVELALAEPGDTGLNSLLDKYWNAWQDVANAPENLATRQALVQAAGASPTASARLQLAARRRSSRRRPRTSPTTIDEVNSIGRQILDLNVQIANATAVGDAPERPARPARRAARQARAARQRLDDAPARTDAIDVTFAGAALVTGTTSSATLAESDLHEPLLRQARRPRRPPRHAAARLHGAARRDRERARHQDEHPARHRLRPERRSPAATSSRRRHDRRDDRRRPRDRSPAPGEGRRGQRAPASTATRPIALAIGDLRDDNAIDVAYRQLVTKIGSDSQEAQRSLANATLLADALSSRRDSISGVSLDEEMTNLHALPARLPGLVARALRDGRDDRPARQPHRDGWACEHAASRSR